MKKINWESRKTIIVNGEKVTANANMLNNISIWAKEAAERYERIGAYALAEEAREVEKEIYNQLDTMGFYDNVK